LYPQAKFAAPLPAHRRGWSDFNSQAAPSSRHYEFSQSRIPSPDFSNGEIGQGVDAMVGAPALEPEIH
jgi:hypothetical protein